MNAAKNIFSLCHIFMIVTTIFFFVTTLHILVLLFKITNVL